MLETQTDFWGKLSRDKRQQHPLADHSADVAAVCEALLRCTLLGTRLARLGGLERLDPQQASRLCVLAAYHDVGKFSIGFQNLGSPGRRPTIGHLPAFLRLRPPMLQQVLKALDFESLMKWGVDEGLLCATIAHHGKPFEDYEPEKSLESGVWEPADGLVPLEGMASLRNLTQQWFPEAWSQGGAPLPHREPFIHGWNGVLNLADWIGSNAEFFPFSKAGDGDRMAFARQRAQEAVGKLGLQVDGLRRALGDELPGFDRISHYTPRPPQSALLQVEPQTESCSLAILEAETGAGKTEAALAYFLRLFHAGAVDSLYFALPTRTAATQIYNRTCQAVERAFPPGCRPPVVQAVPGYLKVDGVAGRLLDDYRAVAEDYSQADWDRYRGWAAEHPKRYLAGAVAVGTIDQALLSALRVCHCHLRAGALLRSLLVVDEVHASDAYMSRILESVLERHLAAGGHALLMSATLGSSSAASLLAKSGGRKTAPPSPEEAEQLPFPLIRLATPDGRRSIPVAASGFEKRVVVELLPWMERPDEIAGLAWAAADQGARVLVVRNTVDGCLAAQQALESLSPGSGDERLFRCRGIASPHHGRYSVVDRRMLDEAIKAAMGPNRQSPSCAAVGTQTLEQSLDLDADLLITDLCPMDVLLQRIGRLHRHDRRRPTGFEQAKVIVLCPDRPLAECLSKNGSFRAGHGLGPIYESAAVLELTRRQLQERGRLVIPRDNRHLVESATHQELVRRFAYDQGGSWISHYEDTLGSRLSKKRMAADVLVDWNKPYTELRFKSVEQRVRTRLGLDDRMARLPKAVASPFDAGRSFDELKIPGLFAEDDWPDDLEAQALQTVDGVLRFSIGRSRFVYDRLGLRREES